MDEEIIIKKCEEEAAALIEGREPVSTQNPPEHKPQPLSSGSSSEQDIKVPAVAVNHQDKGPVVSVEFLNAAGAGTLQETGSGLEEDAQRLRHDDSTESEESLQSPQSTSTSPPYYPQNSTSGLTADMMAPQPQAQLNSLGYAGYGVPNHQFLGLTDPRSFALGQLTAAAQLQLSSESLGPSDNQGRKRDYQDYEDDDDEEEGWYQSPNKKRNRGSKGKQAERWDQMYERLVKFRNLHGHCLVPNRYPEDPSLGAWVSTQRRHYKILTSAGDPNATTPMTQERASRLMAIGFKWKTKDPRHVPWEIRFQQLLEYKEKYGDCVVPIGFKENPRLSNWVSQQRQEYKLLQKGKKARITLEKIQALDSVGFVWEAQRGCNKKKKKRERKKKNMESSFGVAMAENKQQDAAATAAELLSRGIILPPNQPRPDIPPAVLSQVLSHLDARQHSNGIRATEIAAEAQMVEDIMALQQSNAAAAAAAAALAPAPIPDVARRPTLGGALPITSLHHSLSRQVGGSVFNDPWARELQEARAHLMARGLSSPPPRSRVPYQDQIITKHLVDALRQDINVDSAQIGRSIQRIQGMIGSPETTRRISQHEAQNRARRMTPSRQPLPPQDLSAHAEARAERIESQSEASKFGVALQVGEMAKPAPFSNVGVPPAMRNLDRSIPGRDSVGVGAPRIASSSFGIKGRMKPGAVLVAGSLSPRMAVVPKTAKGRGSASETRGSASETLGSVPNWGARRQSFSSGDAQMDDAQDDGDAQSSNDDGGVFSDAEEDEAAMAFLAPAIARRTSHTSFDSS